MSSSEFGPADGLVGLSVTVEGASFHVRRLLAEGGKAVVFLVHEEGGRGRQYAMKRVVVSGDQDRSVLEAANREVEVLRMFAAADNIVSLRAAERKADRRRRLYFYFIVMAFCPKTVLDIMREAKARGARGIARPVVLQIMRDTCRGVLQMHLADPSLAHRDIKVENVLLDEYSNRYQLCDFGSATSMFETWGRCPAAERSRAMDDIESNTTVEYRAPEQCDFLLPYRVDHRVDAWALGCMMYHLMYFRTPFEGGTRLQVMNVDFKFPSSKQNDLNAVIERLLVANPDARMTVGQLLSTVCALGKLEEPVEVAAAKKKGIYEPAEGGGERGGGEEGRAGKEKKKKKKKKRKKMKLKEKKKKKKKKKKKMEDSSESGGSGSESDGSGGGAPGDGAAGGWAAFGDNSGGGEDDFESGWGDAGGDGGGDGAEDGFGNLAAGADGDWAADFSSLDFGSFDDAQSKGNGVSPAAPAPQHLSSGINHGGARQHRSEPHRGRYGSDHGLVGDLLGLSTSSRPAGVQHKGTEMAPAPPALSAPMVHAPMNSMDHGIQHAPATMFGSHRGTQHSRVGSNNGQFGFGAAPSASQVQFRSVRGTASSTNIAAASFNPFQQPQRMQPLSAQRQGRTMQQQQQQQQWYANGNGASGWQQRPFG